MRERIKRGGAFLYLLPAAALVLLAEPTEREEPWQTKGDCSVCKKRMVRTFCVGCELFYCNTEPARCRLLLEYTKYYILLHTI